MSEIGHCWTAEGIMVFIPYVELIKVILRSKGSLKLN